MIALTTLVRSNFTWRLAETNPGATGIRVDDGDVAGVEPRY